MTSSTTAATETGPATARRVLQRQILPIDGDTDVYRLYVDPEAAVLDADKYEVGSNRSAQQLNAAQMRQSTSTGVSIHPDQILDREALRLPAEERISFGSYFNAFPASYWRRWTIVSEVTLTLTVEGQGATVTVYRSMANGRSQRVETVTTGDEASSTFEFELSLKPFVDGGWYWYDVVAGDEDVVVRSAEWAAQVPADRAEHGTVDICITTMNRPDFVAKLVGQLGSTPELRPYLDEVLVMEQGTQKMVDSEFFPEAAATLGDTLRVIEQGNLGGSGGYARGQLESVRKGTATYAMMMDDDVICEPEGVIRAVTFGDLARRPTIVGGHMFSIYARTRLHSFGEIITPWRFWWLSAPGVFGDWDFGARNLRSTRWLHKRIDVDFNGWFMCLIPRQVLDEIGLSLPLFIKWDDSEFGLRAKAGGLPDGDHAGCRGVAHPVDRQERRPGLAGLLPPAQPLRRGAAPLGVRAGRPDGAREPQPPGRAPGLHAVLHRRAAADGPRGRPRGALRPARQAADAAGRGQRVPQAVHRRPAAGRPGRLPARTTPQAAAQGQGRLRCPRPRRRCSSGPRRCRCASSSRSDPPRASTPRRRSRPWTPSGTASPATTRRSSRCPTAARPRSTSATPRSSAT